MGFRFGDFELDDKRREVRLRGREIAVQPRVLDLLLYLVEHRDRVVGKDELLDALWPGTIVVDGALQRVVSLARSVLHQGGARDAIRTHPRHGYRFCIEAAALTGVTMPEGDVDQRVGSARRAFQALAWDEAVAAFAEADAATPLTAADLERWAQAAYWAGDARAAVEPLERAVAAHLTSKDRRGAARCALLLAQIGFERQEMPVAAGWHKRAIRFLQGLEVSREHGLMHYIAARLGLFEGEFERSFEEAERARAIGVELEDPDLEGLGLVYGGHALLARGEVEKGLDYQNEAAAAVLSDQVSSWAGALIYCGLIWTCRNLADWNRAAQWTEQFTRWCERRGMAAFPGTCRLHRAEVLAVQGDIEEAAREIDESTTLLSRWAPWAEGDAHRVLGDLRLGVGDLAGAEAAYRRARELGWDPQPGYARLLLEQGHPEAAMRSLEASMAERDWVNLERRGTLIAHLALAAARAGRAERARRWLCELADLPELCRGAPVEAFARQARAELARIEGRREEAVAELRGAVSVWLEVGSPLQMAHVRLRIGELLAKMGDAAGASVELALAQTFFRAHGAERLAAKCAALLDRKPHAQRTEPT